MNKISTSPNLELDHNEIFKSQLNQVAEKLTENDGELMQTYLPLEYKRRRDHHRISFTFITALIPMNTLVDHYDLFGFATKEEAQIFDDECLYILRKLGYNKFFEYCGPLFIEHTPVSKPNPVSSVTNYVTTGVKNLFQRIF